MSEKYAGERKPKGEPSIWLRYKIRPRSPNTLIMAVFIYKSFNTPAKYTNTRRNCRWPSRIHGHITGLLNLLHVLSRNKWLRPYFLALPFFGGHPAHCTHLDCFFYLHYNTWYWSCASGKQRWPHNNIHMTTSLNVCFVGIATLLRVPSAQMHPNGTINSRWKRGARLRASSHETMRPTPPQT